MHDVTWLLAGRPASRQGHQVRGQGGLLPLAAQACTPSRMPMPFSCMYSTAECWRFAISTRVAVGFFPAIGTAAVCHQPLRPAVLCRLHKAKREIVLYTAVAHAVMAAWGLLLTATAGSQPIVASTVIGAGANIYKLQEIFPRGPAAPAAATQARTLHCSSGPAHEPQSSRPLAVLEFAVGKVLWVCMWPLPDF